MDERVGSDCGGRCRVGGGQQKTPASFPACRRCHSKILPKTSMRVHHENEHYRVGCVPLRRGGASCCVPCVVGRFESG